MIDESLKLPKKVIDMYGHIIHIKDKPLGQGGQGVVCRTKDKNIALKLLVKDGKLVENKQDYAKYKERINDVSVLKIEDDINICRPEIILQEPLCGYVMKLLNDLSPVSELIYTSIDGEYKDYLISDGNLKKRLEVLIDLARVLARLHSKGMIYGDLSPYNVFYSKKDLFSKVWLIDCDNLHMHYEYVPTVFTPQYGAPEIIKETSANTQFSDCFSFAILAFKILTANHPFINDYNSESDSDGWDASETPNNNQSDIDANDVTWLCDKNSNAPSDIINFIKRSVPHNLMDLFDSTFNEIGRNCPTTRPSMRTWFEALYYTYTKLWKCSCGTYNLYSHKTCLSCDSQQKIDRYCSIFSVYNKHVYNEALEELKSSQQDNLFEEFPDNHGVFKDKDVILYDGMSLYNFDFENICVYETPYPYITFNIIKDALIVTNTGKVTCNYYTSDGKQASLIDSIKINKGEKKLLSFYKDNVEYKQLLIVT